MIAPAAYGGEGRGAWHGGLSQFVVSPADGGPVGPDAAGVSAAAADGGEYFSGGGSACPLSRLTCFVPQHTGVPSCLRPQVWNPLRLWW